MKKPIWNLNSDRPTPAHFCDVIVEGEDVTLKVKTGKEKYETISWEDMQYQVNSAIKKATNE